MSERNMLSRVGAVELGMGHGEEIFGVFGWVGGDVFGEKRLWIGDWVDRSG